MIHAPAQLNMLPRLRPALLGLGALSLPAFALAVGSDFDWYNARAILSSIPRTARVVKWAISASLQYYAAFQDPGYEGWPQLHEQWADSLLEVCRTNGGIYVKVWHAQINYRCCCIFETHREWALQGINPMDYVSQEDLRIATSHLLGKAIPTQQFCLFIECCCQWAHRANYIKQLVCHVCLW